MTIPDFGDDLLSVVARTTVVYVFLVLGLRLLGKREAGQLSTLDLVVLLVISNAVQNAMVGQNTSLVGGILAAATVLVLDLGLHSAAGRWQWLQDALDGEPTLLVEDGKVIWGDLHKEGISERELSVALRQNQLLRVEEARYVFLETNGQISVIPFRDGEGAAPTEHRAPEDAIGGPPPGSAGRFHRRRRRWPVRLSGGG